jgi:putative DNA primase/helicase
MILPSHDITPELIRAALAHIPANLPRDEWARVGMAIKSEYPDGTGFDLFDQWSASDGDRYDKKAVTATWRSIKAGGGVAVATLLHLAKEHGFTQPKGGLAPASPSPLEQAERERQRAQRQEQEASDRQAGHELAAEQAAAQWNDASESGNSPYLARKGVQAHGVRFAAGGWLLAPLRDAAGKLWNLQRIAPNKPANGSDKLFLKGGRKSGLWHLVGELASDAAPPVVLIAEGLATAATLYEATGHPVAVAFDAGNLQHVVRALRQQYPAALLVVCGDDDQDTEKQTGTNPGRMKAVAAAKAVRGLAVFPHGLAPGGSDFNDLATQLNTEHFAGAGLEVVRATVEAAIDAHAAAQQTKAPKAKGRQQQSAATPPSDSDRGKAFDRFYIDDQGVWYIPPGEETPRRVCSPLRVTALARDGHDNQAALLLEFDTRFGKGRKWLMPLSMLAGDGTQLRSALLSQGFMAPTDSKRRGWLTEYLQSREPEEMVRHVPRVGWHGRAYVLPKETIGSNPGSDRVMFHSEAGIEANFNQRGTLEQWKQDLARLCVGNSRMAFAVCVALAGPLLAWAPRTSGGGFHYVGPTSIGKTTGFLVAASVWGKGAEKDPESYIQKWRGTSNGFEFLGEQHNDSTLILDEMGQIDASEAGLVSYMLADGSGKARAKAGGGLRQKPTWRILILSSGEVSLAQHMESAGKKMKGGQEIRLIPIPAEVSPGTSMEQVHEFEGGHELSGWIQERAARCYGTAGRTWLEHLVSHTDGLEAALRERMDAIEWQMVKEDASGQVQRGGRRFVLAAAAGEIATEIGLTGWPKGEATRAASICYNDWIVSRGGSGSSETTTILRDVKRFIELHAVGRFSVWHRGNMEQQDRVINRAGWRRQVRANGLPVHSRKVEFGEDISMPEDESTDYLISAEVFKKEVCEGHDPQLVLRVLLDHGCLKPDKGERFSCKPRPPGFGSTIRCYCITSKVFELDT